MKRWLLFILMMPAAWLTASGQFTVQGLVRDSHSGEAVTGAYVHLHGTFKSAVTDGEGRFTFSRIPAGGYTVELSHISYQPLQQQITVTGHLSGVALAMEPAVHVSEEFIITAVRSEEKLPGATTLLTREELKQVNLGQDIPFLLSTAPSVVITSDAGAGIGYTGIRIRGTDQNRINVTINGIPLNDPESHSVYWVDLPDFASSVEDIQIQRGVGTSTNGAGAFGGSVNIRTEKVNPLPYASMTHAAGSFRTLKNSLNFGSGLINDRFAFDGRISRVVSDGYVDRASAQLSSWYLSGGYYGRKTVLKAVVMSGKELTYLAWDGVPSEVLDTNRTWNGQGMYTDAEGKIRFYDNQVDDYTQEHYQLHLSHLISSRWTGNASLHVTTGSGYYETYRERRKYADYGLENVVAGTDTLTRTNLIQQKWLDNIFYGATWSLIRTGTVSRFTFGGAANAYDGDHFGRIIWMQHPGRTPMGHEWYRGNGLKRDVNLFAKYTRNAGPRWLLFADVQLREIDYRITGTDDDLRDITGHHDYLFFNPKGGASFVHNDRHESYAVFGVANREPNRSNFTDAGAHGPVPRDERLCNVEAGHKLRFSRFSATANLYLMYYRDQLVLTGEINDVGSPVMTNVDRSYRAGVELVMGWMIMKNLTWEANLTLSRNRILGFTAYVDDWDTWAQQEAYLGETDIAFSPAVTAASILNFSPVAGGSLVWVSRYVGNQYLDNTGNAGRMLNPWWVNDLHLRYTLPVKGVKEFRLNLMLNNILDTEYESNGWVYRYIEGGEEKKMDGLFPQAGFHLLGGFTVTF